MITLFYDYDSDSVTVTVDPITIHKPNDLESIVLKDVLIFTRSNELNFQDNK